MNGVGAINGSGLIEYYMNIIIKWKNLSTYSQKGHRQPLTLPTSSNSVDNPQK